MGRLAAAHRDQLVNRIMALLRFLLDRYFIKWPWLRQKVTTLLWGNRTIPLRLLGTTIWANTVKENGYCRAQRLASFNSLWREEVPVLISLAMLLENGDTFVDIGANVGVFSATLSRCNNIGRAVRFYAFEANEDTFGRLQMTLRGSDVAAFNLALSDKEGMLDFVEGAVSHVFTSVANARSYNFRNKVTPVRCGRLDEMKLEGHAFVLKIDVEGQELQVLKGAEGLFAQRRVKAVYLDGYKDPQVLEFLRTKGFVFKEGHTLASTDGMVFSLLALKTETKSSGDSAFA